MIEYLDAGEASAMVQIPSGLLTSASLPSMGPRSLASWLTLFGQEWRNLVYGVCIHGAVYEFRFQATPKLDVRQGFLRVENDRSEHFHLCFDDPGGQSACMRMKAFETPRPDGDAGAFRFWNAKGGQMLTAFVVPGGERSFSALLAQIRAFA